MKVLLENTSSALPCVHKIRARYCVMIPRMRGFVLLCHHLPFLALIFITGHTLQQSWRACGEAHILRFKRNPNLFPSHLLEDLRSHLQWLFPLVKPCWEPNPQLLRWIFYKKVILPYFRHLNELVDLSALQRLNGAPSESFKAPKCFLVYAEHTGRWTSESSGWNK